MSLRVGYIPDPVEFPEVHGPLSIGWGEGEELCDPRTTGCGPGVWEHLSPKSLSSFTSSGLYIKLYGRESLEGPKLPEYYLGPQGPPK